jgi:hypothetical protein
VGAVRDRDENMWRAIIAALANDTARTVYAEIILSGTSATLDGLAPSRRRHVIGTLTGAGLVEGRDPDLRPIASVFARALRAAPARARAEGLERFLDAEGKIRAYPADKKVRAELLSSIARQALSAGEVLTEREVNERLDQFTDDVVVLRRYLVDHGQLERTRTGSEYALLPPSDSDE